MSEQSERVFSAIQPTGIIHLGNYLGAIRQWVHAQKHTDCIFCIANTHAITVRQNPQTLHATTYNLAALLLACGIDPKQAILFIQSSIDAHAALAWILECHLFMGELSRMTQFKDKSQQHPKNINAGLFNYPALMAADILLYDVDSVPVGDDQRQHVELARDVAIRFNHEYGETFKIPKATFPPLTARVMSLADPSKKMSKSDSNPNGMITILDSPDTVRAKLKKATTDSVGQIAFNPEQKGVHNLLTIYQSLTGNSTESILSEFEGKGYGVLKERVSEAIIAEIAPIGERYAALSKDMQEVQRILQEGANKANEIASARYNLAKERVGLV